MTGRRSRLIRRRDFDPISSRETVDGVPVIVRSRSVPSHRATQSSQWIFLLYRRSLDLRRTFITEQSRARAAIVNLCRRRRRRRRSERSRRES